MSRFLTLDGWVGILSVSALLGIVLAILGMILNLAWARTLAFVLIAPVILGGILLAVFVIPVLILANRKHKQTSNEEDHPQDGSTE